MTENKASSNLSYQKIDLSWMIGLSFTEVAFREPDYWIFTLAKNVGIWATCPWRIVEKSRIKLSSDDHGQKFGLPAIIDAAKEAADLLKGVAITAVHLREATADLLIDLDGDLRLEIIPLSSGYESWQWSDPYGESYFVQGGGNIVRFPKQKAQPSDAGYGS